MPVPPQAVWDALADPAAYGFWVVGSTGHAERPGLRNGESLMRLEELALRRAS